MKQVESKSSSKNLQKYSGSLSKERHSVDLSLYETKKSFNKSILIVVLLMAGSFFFGKYYSNESALPSRTVSSLESINHFNKLNKQAVDSLNFKEINYDHYISQLNNKEYSSFGDYLAETTRVKDLFRDDMDFNRKVFIAKHDFLGKDKKLYNEFNYNQRKISAEFRELIYQHTDNYKKYLSTKRKMNRIVEN